MHRFLDLYLRAAVDERPSLAILRLRKHRVVRPER
jgi:hypothetical protein